MASNSIQELYVGYFGRAGDPAGVAYWTTAAATQSITQISQSFAVQPETFAQYPALSTPATLQSSASAQATFLTAVYQNLFGHAPDAKGLAYWEGQLSAGVSPGLIIAMIIGGAAGTDVTVMTNKATVAQNYTTAVSQATPAVTWNPANDTPQSRTILAGVTSAAASVTATAKSISAAIAADQSGTPPVAGPSGGSGTTFTLTTGADNFTGDSNNDTFNAPDATVNGSPVPTWTAGDTLVGGTGTNTFNITQTAPINGAPSSTSVKGIQITNITDAAGVTVNTTSWTGLTVLNVTDTGVTGLTVSPTTAVTVTDTAGAVTVSGGSTQAVTTGSGGVTLSGATGGITLTDAALGASAASVSGGTSISATLGGVTVTGPISIGSSTTSGAITANVSDVNTTGVTGSSITATGGTIVNVTQNIAAGTSSQGSAVTAGGGTITVNGGAATTSVNVSQTAAVAPSAGSTPVNGIADGAVNISDANAGSLTKAATIATALLSNYNNSSISSNALANVTLQGTAGTLNITSGLTTNTVTTLDLTVNGLANAPGDTDSIADLSNHYATIAITTTAADSKINSIVDSAATAMTVAGTNALTLTSIASLPALRTITVSGAAGLTADVSNVANAALSDVNASASTGNNTITLFPSQTTFEGGTGINTVKVTSAATKHISGGSGSSNVLDMAGIGGTLLTVASGVDYTSFSTLDATGGSGIFDLSLITGITAVQTGADTGSVSFVNAAAGTSLSILADPLNAVTFRLANYTPTSAMTLNIGTAATTGFTVTGGVDIGNIASLNLVSNGAVSNGVSTGTNQVALTDTVVSSLTVSGAESLILSGLASNTLTSVTDTQAAGATFTLTTVAATSGSGATVTDGEANLVFTGSVNSGSVDTVTAGDGNNTITDATGNDVVNLGNGTNSVTLDTLGTATTRVTVGTGSNSIAVGGAATSGSSTVILGVHGVTTADAITVGATSTGSLVPTATITGLNATGLDTITFAGDPSATAVLTTYTPGALSALGIAVSGSAPTTLTQALNDVLGLLPGGALAQHQITEFQLNGNTYIVQQANTTGTAFSAGDTLVELTGTAYTLTDASTASNGVLQLHG
jgi:S-layer protein